LYEHNLQSSKDASFQMFSSTWGVTEAVASMIPHTEFI